MLLKTILLFFLLISIVISQEDLNDIANRYFFDYIRGVPVTGLSNYQSSLTNDLKVPVSELSNSQSLLTNDLNVPTSELSNSQSSLSNDNLNRNELIEMYNNCIFNNSNYFYDLSSLKGVSLNYTENRSYLYNYYFSICSNNEICNSILNGEIQSCQKISTGEIFPIGSINNVSPFELKENEIILNYFTNERKSKIIISCEHGVEHRLENFDEIPKLTYNYYLKSKYACLSNLKTYSSFICESIKYNNNNNNNSNNNNNNNSNNNLNNYYYDDGIKIKSRDEDIICKSNNSSTIICLNDDNTNCLIDLFGKVKCKNQTEYISCFGDEITCQYNNFLCSINKKFENSNENDENDENDFNNLNNNYLNQNFNNNDFNNSNNNLNLIFKNLIILLLILILIF
ncbi:hypothetical protein ACTFIZ_004115 [Dictyostelium cf. discoideum]